MEPQKLSGSNIIQLAKEQDEYITLDVAVNYYEGILSRTSFWKPNKKELKLLLNNGAVALEIIGDHFPPIKLGVVREAKWPQ